MDRSVTYFNFVGLRWLLSVLFVWAFADSAVSQAIGYVCDFEDSAENALWQLNVGNQGEQCANKWYIGESGRNNGANGLFVSGDNGASTGYNKAGVSVVSYRSITLPAGKYELTFEWQAFGMDSLDGLYVCWVPDSVKTNSVSNSNLQKWVSQYVVPFDSVGRLYQRSWNVACDTIESDGTPHKLVFVWNNGVVGTYPPAACVDNILMLGLGFCDKPSDIELKAQNGLVELSWTGTSEYYDVKCYSSDADKWVTYSGVKGNSVTITDLGEGVCDYYVRSSCGDMYSAWVSHSEFLYYPDSRCIDYLTLNAKNCFYGHTDNPKAIRGVVNYGYQSKASRHTLHWLKTERDPRTDNKLKTVPDGEIASVRLGNWNYGNEAESVEFKYTVDTATSAILLLKYAVVLEDPGHEQAAQPRFTLQVLRGNKPLDKLGCSEADFSAGYTTKGWNVTGGVTWKDWTTVGLNLQQYHGETLTIRLTTYDCTQSGHFGYAYFVLGCSDGKIKGLSCGDSPTNSFKGPDGFHYRWYLPSDPDNILGEEQIFTVESKDTLTYNLDVIQPTNIICYYTLQASALPRYPVSVFEYADTVVNCQNVVRFTNKSYVRRVNHISGDTVETIEPCESTRWDFGDGTMSAEHSPQHIFPQEGGLYTVTLYSGLANDVCVEDTSFVIELPRIGTTRDTVYIDDCMGNVVEFGGKNYFTSGIFSDTLVSSIRCDSIITLHLTMHDKYDIDITDTICSDEEYYLGDRLITESGHYEADLLSKYGCDSVVTLDIIVNEVLDMEFDTIVPVCADDDNILIPFTLHSGMLSDFDIEFHHEQVSVLSRTGLRAEDNMMVIPMTDSIVPGRYPATIKFGGQSCGHDNVDITVRVYYPFEVITQRWNDVLSVRNSGYNGGYDFVSYQWYKNDVPIEGSTSPNYYAEEGLDTTARYSVLLTRADDGVSELVCPVVPRHFVGQEDIVVRISNADGAAYIKADSPYTVRIWNSVGVLLEVLSLSEGETAVMTGYDAGIYLVEIVSEAGTSTTERVVIY